MTPIGPKKFVTTTTAIIASHATVYMETWSTIRMPSYEQDEI